MNHRWFWTSIAVGLLIAGAVFAWPGEQSRVPMTTTTAVHVQYKTITIDGLDVFYREAGASAAPVVLLLHGFPTSSHMFRNLIPALADKFRLVAPDYPGFGNSSMPSVDAFGCPVVPGVKRDDWPLADPKGQPLEEVRAIRDEIRSRVQVLLEEQGWAQPSSS
jgi:alpha/beta hydrolase fold